MVININKTNITELTEQKKNLRHMMLEIQTVLACDRYKNVAGLNWLMGSQPSHLDNWISQRQTIKENTQIHFCLKICCVIVLIFLFPMFCNCPGGVMVIMVILSGRSLDKPKNINLICAASPLSM
jgi:hypothetical protein